MNEVEVMLLKHTSYAEVFRPVRCVVLHGCPLPRAIPTLSGHYFVERTAREYFQLPLIVLLWNFTRA